MIRLLLYDQVPGRINRLRAAVDAVVTEADINNYGISSVSDPESLTRSVWRTRNGFYDVIVCLVTESPSMVFESLRAVRAIDADANIVIVSDCPDYALDAFDIGVDGYCLLSEGRQGLKRAMEGSLGKAWARQNESIGLRADVGVGNVALGDILFVESSKKGSVVHFPDGSTMLVRKTLQAMFELLSFDERFTRAGSSFIVNLDNVRSFGEKAVIFSDGETIVIPIRARKPVKEALAAYCLREAATD